MKIKVSPTGQVTFFPQSIVDIFTLGKLMGRLTKARAFVRWEYVAGENDPLGRKDKQARVLDPNGEYTLHSLTVGKDILVDCIKQHVLKEV